MTGRLLQLILLNQHWSDPRRLVIAARQRLRTIVPYHVMRLAAETFDFKIEAPALSLALGTGSGSRARVCSRFRMQSRPEIRKSSAVTCYPPGLRRVARCKLAATCCVGPQGRREDPRHWADRGAASTWKQENATYGFILGKVPPGFPTMTFV